MKIKRSGSDPSGKGPSDWFSEIVRIDPLFGPMGNAVDWMDHVTDEQYSGLSSAKASK